MAAAQSYSMMASAMVPLASDSSQATQPAGLLPPARPPHPPPADLEAAWVAASALQPTAGAPPVEWGYSGQQEQGQQEEQQHEQQMLLHPTPLPGPSGCWGAAAFPPPDCQTIPADWGTTSGSFGGFAPLPAQLVGGYAATWPPPLPAAAAAAAAAEAYGGGWVPQPASCGPPPFLDAQQMYAAAGPWIASWPSPDQEAQHAYMMAAAAAAAAAASPPPLPEQQYVQAGVAPYFPPDPAMAAAYQPQPYAAVMPMPLPVAMPGGELLPAPAFAISPPAPVLQGPVQSRLGLPRKKKSALPAEPSFGCDSSLLEGGGSAVLLHSPEISHSQLTQVEEEVTGGWTPTGADPSSHQQQPPHQGQAVGLAGRSRSSLARLSSGAAGALPNSGEDWPSHAADGSGADAQLGEAQHEAVQPEAPPLPSIEFDKAPRPVEWRPYSFADYRQRNFDPKQAGKYWALGGLGPARPPGDAEWQAQQVKRERQQQFGQAVSKSNRERIAAQPPSQRAPPARPGADVRERALHFAKTAVPKPTSFKSRQSAGGGTPSRTPSGVAAAAAEAAAAVDGAAAGEEGVKSSAEPGAAEAAAQAVEGAEVAAAAVEGATAAAPLEQAEEQLSALTLQVPANELGSHAGQEETQVQQDLTSAQDPPGQEQPGATSPCKAGAA